MIPSIEADGREFHENNRKETIGSRGYSLKVFMLYPDFNDLVAIKGYKASILFIHHRDSNPLVREIIILPLEDRD